MNPLGSFLRSARLATAEDARAGHFGWETCMPTRLLRSGTSWCVALAHTVVASDSVPVAKRSTSSRNTNMCDVGCVMAVILMGCSMTARSRKATYAHPATMPADATRSLDTALSQRSLRMPL